MRNDTVARHHQPQQRPARRHRAKIIGAALVVLAGTGLGLGIAYAGVPGQTGHAVQQARSVPAPQPTRTPTAIAAPAPMSMTGPFFTPMNSPMGVAFNVEPERTAAGVTLTITASNQTPAPLDLDTGMLGNPTLTLDEQPVYLYTIPMRKHLEPGQGLTWQCHAKLAPDASGQLTLHAGPMIFTGVVPPAQS